MTQGYQSLTQREKQALRLILQGHDAKSMAGELRLSVHTVNEYLRQARRKLAVTSSKEAARRLREIEGQTDKFSGPELFGDAEMGKAGADRSTGRATMFAAQLIGGLFIMSIILGALVLALSPHRADGQQEQVSSEIMAEDMAVEAAARGWLARIEQGDWRGSWNGASQAFRDLNTLEGWTAAARSAHGQLGPALSREVTEHKVVPVPPHGYRIVTFRTDFANRAGVIETLSLVEEDGEWKIAGIFIE